MTEFLLVVGDLVMVYAAIAAIVFATSYAIFFNWRKTSAGRSLMYFVWSLIAVFVSNTIARVLGVDYPLREWVRLAVYVAVAVTITRLVWALWRNWKSELPALAVERRDRNPSNGNAASIPADNGGPHIEETR